MNADEVKAILEQALPDCQFKVESDGSHFAIVAIGDVFEGKRPVQRQQVVYQALNEQIFSGDVHAVHMKTFTHAEWQDQA